MARGSLLLTLDGTLRPHVTCQTPPGTIASAPRLFGARPREGHGHHRTAGGSGIRPAGLGDLATPQAPHERAVSHHRGHGAAPLAAKGSEDIPVQRDLPRVEAGAPGYTRADPVVGGGAGDARAI